MGSDVVYLQLLQAIPAGPPFPWWVLYIVVLCAVWSAYQLGRGKGSIAVPVGCGAFIPVAIVSFMALPTGAWFLALPLSFAPLVAAMVGAHRRGGGPVDASGVERLPGMTHIPTPLQAGQPRPEAVLRSRAMAHHFSAGMPGNARFVARVRFVRGIGEMAAQPVDLFLGGGDLWVAPLKTETPPTPIPARNVLRVDAWPEPEGPPTLRVSWSPPAGDLTGEVVMEAMPGVPPGVMLSQLQAIAGVLATGVQAEAREAERIEMDAMRPLTAPAPTTQPMTLPPPPPVARLRACPNCGESVDDRAIACPRCATRL